MMTLMSHPDIRVIIMQDVQFEDGRINSKYLKSLIKEENTWALRPGLPALPSAASRGEAASGWLQRGGN